MRSVETRYIVSRIVVVSMSLLFILGLLPIVHVFATILWRGFSVLVRDPVGVLVREPPPPGSSDLGGIGPHLLGTLILVSLASLIGVPVSVMSAVYSVESMSRRLGPLTTLLVRVMIEFPTIVVGLTVYGSLLLTERVLNILIDLLGLDGAVYIPRFNALSGAAALAIVLVPYVYTQTEEGLRSVPHHIREAVYSLGFSRARASLVLMGYTRTAVLSGVMIGVSKILGETAPLLFTAFGNDSYVTRFPDILTNPIGSLTLWIYKAGLSPYDNWIDLAWAASLILLLMTTILFSVGKYIVYRGR